MFRIESHSPRTALQAGGKSRGFALKDSPMLAKYILSALAVVFLLAALWRLARDGFRFSITSRTWLLVALIFGAVSGWLWWLGVGKGSW